MRLYFDVPKASEMELQQINVLRRNGAIERCAVELEKAYAECETLNLLHGAARLRAMKAEVPPDVS